LGTGRGRHVPLGTGTNRRRVTSTSRRDWEGGGRERWGEGQQNGLVRIRKSGVEDTKPGKKIRERRLARPSSVMGENRRTCVLRTIPHYENAQTARPMAQGKKRPQLIRRKKRSRRRRKLFRGSTGPKRNEKQSSKGTWGRGGETIKPLIRI